MKKEKKKSSVLKVLGIAGLAGALLVPGLDLLAAPALIAVLVGMTNKGGKK